MYEVITTAPEMQQQRKFMALGLLKAIQLNANYSLPNTVTFLFQNIILNSYY
jgi:hypothetical protein